VIGTKQYYLVCDKNKNIFTCGTDTYINIDKLLIFLDNFNSDDNLYIGGHGNIKQLGNNYIKFLFGGAGIILTKSIIKKLYKNLDKFFNDWKFLCIKYNIIDLICSCDLLLAFYIKIIYI
jgi:hypothetical protein